MALGKSTFLNLISGIFKPTKGEILVDGINTKNKKDFLNLRKKIGIVFQNPDTQILFPRVYDDIEFALKNLKIEDKKERIEEALKKVLNYLLEQERFNIVISNFYDGNEEITKKKETILKNVGMTKEACLRSRKINVESGKAENKIIYSITKEEIA